MTTFLTFIGLIALFIVGKFIYDTYLTNNTERDWQEYKRANPHEANVLESNEGLNFKTDYKVRKDGIYVHRHAGVSQYGQAFKITMFLIFNNKNRVFKSDIEGFPEIDKSGTRELLQELSEQTELNSNCTEYFCEKGQITMKFMNSSTHGEEYSGSIIKDGLILTRKVHYWDEMQKGPNTRLSLQDMKFEFIKV